MVFVSFQRWDFNFFFLFLYIFSSSCCRLTIPYIIYIFTFYRGAIYFTCFNKFLVFYTIMVAISAPHFFYPYLLSYPNIALKDLQLFKAVNKKDCHLKCKNKTKTGICNIWQEIQNLWKDKQKKHITNFVKEKKFSNIIIKKKKKYFFEFL